MQTAEKTVREIALEDPTSIRVFEALGIDYCCGGKKSLSDACSGAAVDLTRVLKLLDQAKRDPNSPECDGWNERGLGELSRHIVEKHHAFVRQETPRIQSLLVKVMAKHGAAHTELAQIERLFAEIAHELATHMMKEEQVLFPYIERMEQAVLNGNPVPPAFFGTVKRPIASMVAEHDDAGALLAQMRDLSDGFVPPTGACATFVALYGALEDFERDLHHHVHLENNILFPRAIEMEESH